ncbi:MAG: phosphatase PAP2 family protein [Candidatus Helarchaeota archaeon]|nr:phosphatase PAP2 family protein [Candidatus Helarchaeota archaeon]
MQRSTSQHVARIISFMSISPFQIVLYLVFANLICQNFAQEMILDTISGTFFLLIPLIPLWYLTRQNRIKNYSINREDRGILFLIQIIGFTMLSIIYYVYPSYTGLDTTILFIFAVGYTILQVFSLIITSGLKHKISLHMTGAASCITALIIVLGWEWAFLYVFCLPIAWARVKLQAHTRAQVIFGTLLGILTILFTYLSFGYLF